MLKKWTRQETRILRKLFCNNPNKAIAAVLDRTEKAVERKASTLRLKKSKKYIGRMINR